MGQKYWAQLALTLVILFGGGWIATRNEQPIEVRMSVMAIVGGAVGWWFKSPQQAATEKIAEDRDDKS